MQDFTSGAEADTSLITVSPDCTPAAHSTVLDEQTLVLTLNTDAVEASDPESALVKTSEECVSQSSAPSGSDGIYMIPDSEEGERLHAQTSSSCVWMDGVDVCVFIPHYILY